MFKNGTFPTQNPVPATAPPAPPTEQFAVYADLPTMFNMPTQEEAPELVSALGFTIARIESQETPDVLCQEGNCVPGMCSKKRLQTAKVGLTFINAQASCVLDRERPMAYVDVTGQRYADNRSSMPLFCDTGAMEDIVSWEMAKTHGVHINTSKRNDSMVDVQGNPIECVGTGIF